MKPMTTYDLAQIEARARALRAAAMRDGARAVKRWIAARLSALRPAHTRVRHG